MSSRVFEFLGIQLDVLRGIRSRETRPVGSEYIGPIDLVYREGRHYPKVAAYDEERWRYVGQPQSCYSNAIDLALQYPDELTYVEGYGMSVIPVNHAWCVTADGTVVDPTWVESNGVTGGERDYFGIPFKLDFVLDALAAKGTYGIIDDWEHDYPLCQEPLDLERCVA